MSIWTFVILTLAAFRIQRLVTADKFPPSQLLRRKVTEQFGEESSWAEWVTCPWCLGGILTIGVFLEHRFLGLVPMWAYTILAAMSLVGYLGSYDGHDE